MQGKSIIVILFVSLAIVNAQDIILPDAVYFFDFEFDIVLFL